MEDSGTMLKGQKVEDSIEVLPQPGLQAEETDVEVSGLHTLGRLPARVFVGGTLTRIVKTPAHQAHLEEEDGVGQCQPYSKTQPVCLSVKGLPPDPAGRTCTLPDSQPPPSPTSHLEKPVSPLKENRAPRFSCRGRRDKRQCHPGQMSPKHLPGSAGMAFLPLQGLSSCSIPLHRNWSVTTSLTFIKLGKAFLFSETALIQFVRCNTGSRREERAGRH